MSSLNSAFLTKFPGAQIININPIIEPMIPAIFVFVKFHFFVVILSIINVENKITIKPADVFSFVHPASKLIKNMKVILYHLLSCSSFLNNNRKYNTITVVHK